MTNSTEPSGQEREVSAMRLMARETEAIQENIRRQMSPYWYKIDGEWHFYPFSDEEERDE